MPGCFPRSNRPSARTDGQPGRAAARSEPSATSRWRFCWSRALCRGLAPRRSARGSTSPEHARSSRPSLSRLREVMGFGDRADEPIQAIRRERAKTWAHPSSRRAAAIFCCIRRTCGPVRGVRAGAARGRRGRGVVGRGGCVAAGPARRRARAAAARPRAGLGLPLGPRPRCRSSRFLGFRVLGRRPGDLARRLRGMVEASRPRRSSRRGHLTLSCG